MIKDEKEELLVGDLKIYNNCTNYQYCTSEKERECCYHICIRAVSCMDGVDTGKDKHEHEKEKRKSDCDKFSIEKIAN